jgi:diguanylate cyclase (GGDEF)-like protein
LRRPRIAVAAKLAVVLCGIAALATGLALIFQERALSAELHKAARERLSRSALAVDQLVESHLEFLLDRYRAISATPELRANLETKHAPTLVYHAERLAREQGASLLFFVENETRWIAPAGDVSRVPAALSRLEGSDPTTEFASLVAHGGRASAMVALPLLTGRHHIGRLVAVEPLADETLALWSRLCGADVYFAAAETSDPEEVTDLARRFDGLELRVAADLEAERRALFRARSTLVTAGALALALAFGASLLVARGLVRPIQAIQAASVAIARGDLGVRLASRRKDEIGEVSRAFDRMLDRLQATLGALCESREGLASAQRLAHLGSFTLDVASSRIQGSEEFQRIYAFAAEEGTQSYDDLLRRIHPDDRERFATALRRCIEEGTPFRLNHRSVELNGREAFLRSQGKRVSSADTGVRLEGTVQDITERKLVEDQVRYLGYHDSLTGLGNRRLFVEHLALAIQAARHEARSVAVLLLDLDGFKLINDTLGHSIGDRVILEVADRLVAKAGQIAAGRSVAREQPSVGVARLGGDEFAVLLDGISGPEAAARAARGMLQVLSNPIELDGQEVVIGASIGITTWPADGEDVETLVRNADTAMYHAKDQGRNSYQFYAAPMNAAVFKRLLLENKLRRAIERDELELHFQPKVKLETGRVTGLEALARWRDPDLGIVAPSEFIPLAEETGLIGAIGEWAVRAAVLQARAWREQGISDLRVSVNLSGRELDDSLVQRVIGFLEEAAVGPECLDLEITETALMSNEALTSRVLRELRSLGVTISLDDFGTGYSSLSYLRSLPIDTVKIDRSFIQRIESEPDDASLIAAIISMAKVLRLAVTVEGVENDAQLQFLREVGCDEVQGNWLSPPIEPSGVAAMLREFEGGRRLKRRARARQKTLAPDRARGGRRRS